MECIVIGAQPNWQHSKKNDATRYNSVVRGSRKVFSHVRHLSAYRSIHCIYNIQLTYSHHITVDVLKIWSSWWRAIPATVSKLVLTFFLTHFRSINNSLSQLNCKNVYDSTWLAWMTIWWFTSLYSQTQTHIHTQPPLPFRQKGCMFVLLLFVHVLRTYSKYTRTPRTNFTLLIR